MVPTAFCIHAHALAAAEMWLLNLTKASHQKVLLCHIENVFFVVNTPGNIPTIEYLGFFQILYSWIISSWTTLPKSFAVTHLYVFANDLYDLQVKLLGWGSRQVDVTQETIDDL